MLALMVEHKILSISKVGGNDEKNNQNQPNEESDKESYEESGSHEDPFLPCLLKLLTMI